MRHTVLAAAVLLDFSPLCLGSRIQFFFYYELNFLDVKRLSLENSILFYCVLCFNSCSHYSVSFFTQAKALCIKLSIFVP